MKAGQILHFRSHDNVGTVRPGAAQPLNENATSEPADQSDVSGAVSEAPKKHTGRRIAAGALLALTVGTGVASATTSLPATVGSAVHTVTTAEQAVFGHNPNADPPSAYGSTYTIPAQGTPASTNTVYIGVEGMDGSQHSYTPPYTQIFETNGPNSFDVHAPITMVHEGVYPTRADDVTRLAGDYMQMKQVEGGDQVTLAETHSSDPAVNTTYNLLKQNLDAGHNVVLIAHSGGGGESGLALNMLGQQPHYKTLIGEHVRVLSMAGLASAQDYQDAGVKPGNVLYIGDSRDAVAQAGHQYMDPGNPVGDATSLVSTLTGPNISFGLGTPHSPSTIVPENHTAFETFMAGGQGGTYIAHHA